MTAGAAYHDAMTALGESALENRENIVRLLNAYITSLINLRDEIDANDRKAVTERLENALRGRKRWFDGRITADWVKDEEFDAPTFAQRMGQLFMGSRLSDRQKQRK